MWKPEHRLAADRRSLRYPSDLTDAEWAIVAPMIPPARHGGRKRSVNVREVLNGIFYVLWGNRSADVSEPIREVLESEESDVIPCWAPDSRRSAPCGHPIIAAPRTAGACVIQAI